MNLSKEQQEKANLQKDFMQFQEQYLKDKDLILNQMQEKDKSIKLHSTRALA